MPDYVTVYQISGGTSGLLFALLGLAPLAIGLVLIAGKWRLHWRRPGWLFAAFWCAFGIMWIFLVSGPAVTEGVDAFRAFQTGQYSVIEGTVEDFHPMPYEGHDSECFTVASKRFCYSDYMVTPGFHNAASHGGPIRAGIHVRIAYLDGTILRLEIPPDEMPSPAKVASRAKSAEREYAIRTGNDPFLQQISTALLFTATCCFLWCTLRWHQAVRFCVKPPTTRLTVFGVRIFFAFCLIGSLNGFVEQIQRHPITEQNAGPILLTALVMCSVVATMIALCLWLAARRERRANNRL